MTWNGTQFKHKGDCKCTNEKICKGCKNFYEFAYGKKKKIPVEVKDGIIYFKN